MTRKYKSIWDALSTTKVGTELQVKCHSTAVTTLIQGVKKEKSLETAQKKRLGLRFAGKMEFRTEEATPSGYVIVFFKLQWDGRRL